MRLTLRLAFRNLSRNKRRSILTLLAVLIPVVLLEVVWGFIGAMERSVFENTIRLETGHLQIELANDQRVGQTRLLIRDVRPVLAALQEELEIEWYTLRLELPALAAAGGRSRGVLLQGVEPAQSERISVMSHWVHQGRYLAETDTNVAVAGEKLLEKLDLGVGSRLIVLASHPETGTGVLLPEIVGGIDAPNRELSRGIVQISLNDARRLVRAEYAATSVITLVKGVTGPWDAPVIRSVAERLQQRLGEAYEVKTWEELVPQLVGILKLIRPIDGAFMMIFFLLSGLVVLNTLYLNVVERTHELGVVLALGFGRRRMLTMITMEALLLAVIGSAIGSAIGLGLVAWGSGGLVMPDVYKESYASLGVEPVLHLSIGPWEAALSAVVMLVVAMLAAWRPAWQEAKLEPVEAMRAV